jgi:hypothetical protein
MKEELSLTRLNEFRDFSVWLAEKHVPRACAVKGDLASTVT